MAASAAITAWMLRPLATLAALVLLHAAPAADVVMTRLDFPPFHLETDVGDTPAERKKIAGKYATFITTTANYFLEVYGLTNTCFEDYATTFDPDGKTYDRTIRFRVWRRYDEFLADYQKRYGTKSIPGAYFGINLPKDEYGKPAGKWLREIATSAEGQTETEVLRHLYHEMGHLFMRTFIVWPVEVPSWIEEGTAELFQLRPGNGTKPEAERLERQGWLVEMVDSGVVIPWPEFTAVRNIDNLDFTHLDPLRSTVQYAQAWSVAEFMLASPKRRAAFKGLLDRFKIAGREALDEVDRRGLKNQAARDYLDQVLYARQQALFKESYGADLLSVEGTWKEWVRKEYESDVKRKPILRYHRGDWWAGPVAQTAKTPQERAAALAKAETIFRECVELTPKLAEGHVGLGRIALARGDAAAAGTHFARAVELGADSFDAQLYGGVARWHGGDAKGGAALLVKAVDQRPTHPFANLAAGQALAVAGGQDTAALAHLRRARDLRETLTGEAALLEGMIQYRAGDLSAATISFLRASTAAKDDPMTAMALVLTKAAAQATEDAQALLAAALREGNPLARAVSERLAAGKLPELVLDAQGVVRIQGVTTADAGAAPSGAGAAAEPPAKPRSAEEIFGPSTE